MSPTRTAFNFANLRLAHAILCRNFLLPSRVNADTLNVLLCQFRGGAFLTNEHRSMAKFIGSIVGWGVPPKLGKLIVFAISIIMAPLHANGAWATKRSKNEHMNVLTFSRALSPEADRGPLVVRARAEG